MKSVDTTQPDNRWTQVRWVILALLFLASLVSGKLVTAATGIINTGGNAVGGIGALIVSVTAKVLSWVSALGTGSVFAIISVGLWFLFAPTSL